MKRKTKATEPSPLNKLSAKFWQTVQDDFDAHNIDVIKQLREQHIDRYAELISRMIARAEEPSGVFDKAKSMDDIGRGLLAQVGLTDPSETQIQMAIAANDR